MDLKCLILAAGYAMRLWPLTKNRPKPLLDVKGKPMLEHIFASLSQLKCISEVFIVTNEKFAPDFEDWAKSFSFSIPIHVINDLTTSNDDRRGAVGDMQYAISDARIDDELLVIAGDNLFEYSLADFEAHFRGKGSSVVAVKDMGGAGEVREKFGVVELDADGRVTGFEEKPKEPRTSLAATACYIFTREDVAEISKYIDSGNRPDNAGDFIKWLANHRPVYAFVFREKWYDIGTFESLGKAREEFNA